MRMDVRVASAAALLVAVAAGVAALRALRFGALPRDLVLRPVNSIAPPVTLVLDRVWTIVVMDKALEYVVSLTYTLGTKYTNSAAVTIADHDGLTIEQETSKEARRLELERKQTIPGAFEALKAEILLNFALSTDIASAKLLQKTCTCQMIISRGTCYVARNALGLVL